MSKKKQKYYVVWEGANPGIYSSWDECKLQIQGFPGAKYRSYKSKAEAQSAYEAPYKVENKSAKKPKPKNQLRSEPIIWQSLSVDAACSGSPGIMEYRGVWTSDGVELFRKGPFAWGTNNVGEFLALVHGIAMLQKLGHTETPIYSDSRTALSWLRNKRIKTTLERRESNVHLFELLERAELWIKTNSWNNPVLKWETGKWGEIPADFGRK